MRGRSGGTLVVATTVAVSVALGAVPALAASVTLVAPASHQVLRAGSGPPWLRVAWRVELGGCRTSGAHANAIVGKALIAGGTFGARALPISQSPHGPVAPAGARFGFHDRFLLPAAARPVVYRVWATLSCSAGLVRSAAHTVVYVPHGWRGPLPKLR